MLAPVNSDVRRIRNVSKAGEILAKALEADASAQDRGEYSEIGMKYDEILCEVLPINDIPSDLFALAMNFWDDWCDAANHEWRYHEPCVERDWPRLARTIASHLRESTLPNDQSIIESFTPKPKLSLLARLGRMFGVRA